MLSLRNSIRGKHLVATGITGFLGKVWLAMTLDRFPEVRRVTVLARGKKGQSATERMEEILASSPALRPLREKLGEGYWPFVDKKIRVLDASLSAPGCGLDESELRAIADADAVLHFAGLTDFEPDPNLAVDANIEGSLEVARLATRTRGRRYLHVSTCFVAGYATGEVEELLRPGISPTGDRFDPRAELDALQSALAGCESKRERIDTAMERAQALGWPNVYTYTKGLAEHLVEHEFGDELQHVTFRPAIVECAEHYPFQGWNEGINTSGPLVWLLSEGFERLPAGERTRFDIVPVDLVARSLTLSLAALLQDRAEHVYQCGSSHENPLDFERAVEVCGLALRKLHRSSDDAWIRNVRANRFARCVDPDTPQTLGYRRMRQLAQASRELLKHTNLSELLPPRLYDELGGDKLQERVKSTSMSMRRKDRELGQVTEILRQYRPFIHDLDYGFRADHLLALSEELSEDEREFAYDIGELDWRRYWRDVQVPGLARWAFPLMRGEKVENDPPLARPSEDVGAAEDSAEVSAEDAAEDMAEDMAEDTGEIPRDIVDKALRNTA